MEMNTHTRVWRRLDMPGHDPCRLRPSDDGWQLEGVAVFRDKGAGVCLAYRLELGAEWITSRGVVTGWFGDRDVRLEVARDVAGLWTLNDQPQSGLDGCVDLDLGFTPATNLSQLERVTRYWSSPLLAGNVRRG